MVADSTDSTHSSALDALTQTVTRSVLEKVNARLLEPAPKASVELRSDDQHQDSSEEQIKIEKLAASILQSGGEAGYSNRLDSDHPFLKKDKSDYIDILKTQLDRYFDGLEEDNALGEVFNSVGDMLKELKEKFIQYIIDCPLESEQSMEKVKRGNDIEWNWIEKHLKQTEDKMEKEETRSKDKTENVTDKKEGRMEKKKELTFENWGLTVKNYNQTVFYPTSREEVIDIVKKAKKNNKRVRVSGMRHSWSDIFGEDDEYIISMVAKSDLDVPMLHFPQPMDPFNDLQGIEVISENGVKAQCKIGAATTGRHFREWVIRKFKRGDKKNWTMPLDVIMQHITYGGSNAPICHGAGWKNKTLSDLVTAMEFVDPNGEIREVHDREQLKALAGCFGMMGVVISLTFELDRLTYAKIEPEKMPVMKAIPPPADIEVPWHLKIDMSEEERKDCYDKFVKHCEEDYYSEWFWFIFQKKTYINCWNNVDEEEKENPIDYPTLDQRFKQWVGNILGEYMVNLCGLFEKKCLLLGPVVPLLQAWLMGKAGMNALGTEKVETPLIDAIHFREGIQNMRVRDIEWEIPIPDDGNGKPDWTIVQKAWWAAITAVYNRYTKHCLVINSDIPMRLCLEMRITAGSDIFMAPQHGNQFGTCSIEVLTPQNVDKDDWLDFSQEITDVWSKYTNHDGKPLNIRPHWAKQWQGLKVRGRDIEDYLVEVAYKDQMKHFETQLKNIARKFNFTMNDACDRFSNKVLRQMFKQIYDGEKEGESLPVANGLQTTRKRKGSQTEQGSAQKKNMS